MEIFHFSRSSWLSSETSDLSAETWHLSFSYEPSINRHTAYGLLVKESQVGFELRFRPSLGLLWHETFYYGFLDKNKFPAVFIVKFGWWLRVTKNMKWFSNGFREIALKSRRECTDSCRIDVLRELGLYVATELWLELNRYVATELGSSSVAT